jgi:site-specific recombinase XerD
MAPAAARGQPLSAGTRRIQELIFEHAWSSRTTRTRQSQWRCWTSFCDVDGWPALPVSEASLLAFIGWLANERDAGRRSVSAVSLPQYLAAVKHMQQLLWGTAVPAYHTVPVALRAYARWEEGGQPTADQRIGVPATIAQAIWALGIDPESSVQQVRDTALVTLSYCLGLRESSAVSIRADAITIDATSLQCRLSIVKGRIASSVPPVAYSRVSTLASPVDLFQKWDCLRPPQPLWFALNADEDVHPRTLTHALQRCLDALQVAAPAGCKYSSHSLRIGAHTEQVLLGWPLEVRLARFGWRCSSHEMASLYFDRTIRSTAASSWFFGAPPVG